MRVAIVGAGMAGLSCAARLKALGIEARLFDKGKGASGRMASRRLATPLGEAVLDMGAQYFTARNPAFQAAVERWAAVGLAAPWPAAGSDAWVGAPQMSAPLKAMAEDEDVRWNTFVGGVSQLPDGWRLHLQDVEEGPFDAVVVALPAEQATPLLALNDAFFMRQSARAVSAPCWTGLFVFDRPLAGEGVIRERGILDWACRNSAKPGRGGPEAWGVHATPAWSLEHLDLDPSAVERRLLAALFEALGEAAQTPIAAAAHRWRFARSAGLGLGHLWNPSTGLGVCGDWLLAPRVESAWLSGFTLADKMAQQPVRRAAGAALSLGPLEPRLEPSAAQTQDA